MINYNKRITFFRLCYLIVIFLSTQVLSIAQDTLNVISDHIDHEDGLRNDNYNWFITKDSRSFIWIGSTDGLNRFDGLNIQSDWVKKVDTINSGEVLQSYFFEDKKGNLWFSTTQSLSCINRISNQTSSFQVKIGSEFIQEDYRIFHIEKDKNILWLSAKDSIYTFDIKSEKFESVFYASMQYSFTVSLSKSGEVNKIYASPWYYEDGFNIFYKDNNSGKWKVKKNLAIGTSNSNSPPPKISNIAINKNSLYLFSDIGLIHLKENDLNDLEILNPPGYANSTFINGVVLSNGYLLVATEFNGLWLLDTKTNTFKRKINTINSNGNTIHNGPIDAIYLDPEGIVWVSLRENGIIYFNSLKLKNNFKNFIKSTRNQISVKHLMEDQSGNKWITTQNNGIFVVNEKENKIDNINFPSPTDSIINSEKIHKMSVDNDGIIWCFNDRSIYKLDKNQEWELIHTINKARITNLAHLDFDKHILITSSEVYEFQIHSNNTPISFKPVEKLKSTQAFSFRQIFQSKDGTIILPHLHKEIWIGKYFRNSFDTLGSISNPAQIFTISENNNSDKIWLGTSEGVAYLKDRKEIIYLSNKPGQFGTSNVYGVFEDDSSRVWFSTNTGIYCYDQRDSTLLRYREEDGLSSEEFSEFAALRASDGKLWFGSKNGLTVFHPDSIQPYPYAPNVHIEELLINNVPFEGDTVISEKQFLHLPRGEKSLAFELRAVGYYLPELSTLQYRLKGYDDTWTTIKNGESARFTKVDAGKKFTLEIIAFNANGKASPIKKMGLYIEPPLIQKLWFQALLFFTLLSIGYGYYRFRINQIRKAEAFKRKEAEFLQKEAEYKALVAETETAILRLQMNPHFIFNSMNSISSYILQNNMEKANVYLNRFAKLMRMILKYAANPLIAVSDEIELLDLYLKTEGMRMQNKFDYSFELENDLDPDEFMLPTMILQPFVENAIWHGLSPKKEGGKIIIRFKEMNNGLTCSVEDNGIGREAARKIGRKMQKHESKAITITNKRLELLKPLNGVSAKMEVIDLQDKEGLACGTKVLLHLPVL